MIPCLIKFEHRKVDKWVESTIDADRSVLVGRDPNGVYGVQFNCTGSYKPLTFLLTEESAHAMMQSFFMCMSDIKADEDGRFPEGTWEAHFVQD